MKQSDIISVVGIAFFGFIVSYFIVDALMKPDEASVTYKTVSPISNSVTPPDQDMFNVNAINPVVEVHVGNCVDENGNGVIDDTERESCYALDSN